MTVLSVIGIALMVVSGVLFVLGHKEKARQAKKAGRIVNTTNRAIRAVRVVMAFTSGMSGLGLTGYDLVTHCGDDESLRHPPAIVQLVSDTTPLAQGEEDEEGEGEEDEERCDD